MRSPDRPQILSAQLPGPQAPYIRLALDVGHLKQHRRRVVPAAAVSLDHPQSYNRFTLHFRAQVELASLNADVTGFRALDKKMPPTVKPADVYRKLRCESLWPLRRELCGPVRWRSLIVHDPVPP
jgi:hypothetical protein